MGLEREWMRGAAPLAVLTLLRQRAMYGYELVEALERESGGMLEMGQSTVYPLLYSLEGRGLLRATWRTAPSGRRRKYYEPTPAGRRWAESQREQFETLVEAFRRISGAAGAGPEPAEAP